MQNSQPVQVGIGKLEQYLNLQYLKRKEFIVEISSKKTVIDNDGLINAAIRIHFAQLYFSRLKKLITDNDISTNKLTISTTTRLVDSILLGTTSEKVMGK